MMTGRRMIPWAVGCGLGLALVAGIVLTRHRNSPALPAVSRYANLPDSFQQAIQETRDQVRSPASEPESVRKLARLYHANRLFREARACYRVVESTPGGLDARDHYYLADIAQNENDLEGAQAELRAVRRSAPGYVPARVALAETLFKSGQAEEAGKEYSAVLAIEANHSPALLGLARVALQRGEDDSAVARLEELMAAHPGSTAGAALLAQLLNRRGDPERAAGLTQLSQQTHEPVAADPWLDALLVDCYDVTHLALVSEQYLTAGQIAEALPVLQRIEELDPSSWIPPMLRGWSQKLAGHQAEAVAEFRRALQQGGDPEKICPLLVASLLTLGHPTEAATLLAEYHAKLPASIPLLRSYAEVAVRMGNDQLARELLTKVLQAEPYTYMANMSMVTILWNAGERDEAAQYLKRVAKIFPADVDSRGLLAQYYLERSDPGSAISPLEQALVHVPPQTTGRDRLTTMLGSAYLMAGEAEVQQGHFAAAVDFSAKATRLAPADPRGYALEANARLRLKDFPRAKAVLENMISLSPGNPTIHINLGDVLYQQGEADQARQHWEKARQLAAAGDSELRAALDLRLSGRVSDETFK